MRPTSDHDLRTSIPAWACILGFLTGLSVFALMLLSCVAGTMCALAAISLRSEFDGGLLAFLALTFLLGAGFGVASFGMARLTNRLLDERMWRVRFIKAEECPSCRFCIRGLTSDRCPECGEWLMTTVTEETPVGQMFPTDAAT